MKKSTKKGERRKHDFQSQTLEDSDLENLSEPYDNGYNNGQQNYEILFETELNLLNGKREKSASSRADSMGKILKFLRCAFLPHFLHTQKSTLFRVLKQGLTSDVKEEIYSSAKILSLLCISCPEWKDLHDQFVDILVEFASKHEDFEIRSVSLETFCTFIFIFEQEESTTNSCFEFLKEILRNEKELPINNETEIYFSTALDMWSLMLTQEEDEVIVNDFLPEDLESIVCLLNNGNLHVRLAACEALSLLCESVAHEEAEDYSMNYFRGYCELDELVETLSTSDLHQQKKINKKDREKQRHSFKDALNTLETGTTPSIHVSVKGFSLDLETRKDIIKLDFFRYILEVGFLHHMESNPLLSQIFDMSLPKELSSTDKSEAKKLNSATREKEAKSRAQIKKTGMENKYKKNRGEEDE